MDGEQASAGSAAPATSTSNVGPGTAPARKEAGKQLAHFIAQEQACIKDANPIRSEDMDGHWLGLALSGGGIRSASFALGILQALSNWDLFRRIDYLSTVSGGGYIGSSLTYFLQARKMGENGTFPFGKLGHAGARSVETADTSGQEDEMVKQFGDWIRRLPLRVSRTRRNAEKRERLRLEAEDASQKLDPTSIVSYIRLHAHYLTPSPDLGWPVFIGSAIRAAFTALSVYFPLLLAAMIAVATLQFALAQLESLAILSKIPAAQAFFVHECHAPTPEAPACPASPACPEGGAAAAEKTACPTGAGIVFFNWPLLMLGVVMLMSIWNAFCFVWRTDDLIDDKKESVKERREDLYPDTMVRNARRNGGLLILFAGCLLLAILPWLVHYFVAGVRTVLAASLSTLVGYLGTLWDFRSKLKGSIGNDSILGRVRPIVFAILTAYGLLVLALAGAQSIVTVGGPNTPLYYGPIAFAVVLGFSFLINSFSNLNLISQHRMYRDRLMETFCPSNRAVKKMAWRPSILADRLKLSECGPHRIDALMFAKNRSALAGPYHLINTALVVPGSKSTLYRSRSGDNFVLSPLSCGSDATGYVATTKFMNGAMTLPTAMAISGAALNAHSGAGQSAPTRNSILGFLLTLFGAQLGFWAAHPFARNRAAQPRFFNPGLYSLTGTGLDGAARRGFVQLADGGHFENLALYELIRRRVDLIVCGDAAQDQDYGFEDLGIAVERVRVDFGTNIEFIFPSHGPADLLPGAVKDGGVWTDSFKMAKRGFAIAEIHYPRSKDPITGNERPEKLGYLLYFKPTLIDGLPSDIYAYKRLNSDFPNQTTVDQDFDEFQFEAYRELGYRLVKQCFVELFEEDDKNTKKATAGDKSEPTQPAPAEGESESKKRRDVKITMKRMWERLERVRREVATPAAKA